MIRYNIFAFYITLILLATSLLYIYSRSYFDEEANTQFVVAENRTVLQSARLSILTASGGALRAHGERMVYHIDNNTFSFTKNVSVMWDDTLVRASSRQEGSGSASGSGSGSDLSASPKTVQHSYTLLTEALEYGTDKVFYLPVGGEVLIRSANMNANANTNATPNPAPNPSIHALSIRVMSGVLVFDPNRNIIFSKNANLQIISNNFTLHSVGTANMEYTLNNGDVTINGMSEVVETATGNTLVSDNILFNSRNSTIKFLGNVNIKVEEFTAN